MKRKFTKWHKKGLGAVFAFAVTLCTGLLASGQTAYASTIYTDTESNNSHEAVSYTHLDVYKRQY